VDRGNLDQTGSEYDQLLLVEDLESLFEELEEAGFEGSLDSAALPADLSKRVQAAGVKSVGELRARLEQLHSHLDERREPD
jgi:hypothetical protein